jgi:hypothetical protein
VNDTLADAIADRLWQKAFNSMKCVGLEVLSLLSPTFSALLARLR